MLVLILLPLSTPVPIATTQTLMGVGTPMMGVGTPMMGASTELVGVVITRGRVWTPQSCRGPGWETPIATPFPSGKCRTSMSNMIPAASFVIRGCLLGWRLGLPVLFMA